MTFLDKGGKEKGLCSVVANIFVSFIGGGVLGLPYAFKEAGVIEGAVIMMVVGIISIYAMLLIVKCKYRLLEQRSQFVKSYKLRGAVQSWSQSKKKMWQMTAGAEDTESLLKYHVVSRADSECDPLTEKMQDLTYGDLGYFAMGWFGRLVVDVVLLVSQIGFCCAYLIFICENMSDNIKGMSIVGCLGILLFLLCPLAFVRQLNTLSISSFLAQCSSLLAFAVVFWFDFQHINHVVIHPKKISLAGFPFFLAISIYCYEGAGMVLSLESSVVKEKRNRFNFVFISTMALVTFLYIAFGVCGYLSFGKATNPIITLNLPKGKSLDFAMIVKSFLCLSMFFTYPVMMFPASKVLENHLITEPEKYIWKGNILRMLLVLLTGLVVITIPDFANLMALIGATCCTLLAFILPGLFHFIIFKESTTLMLRIFDVTLMFIGVIGALIGTYDAVNRLSVSNSHNNSHLLNITQIPLTHAAVPK